MDRSAPIQLAYREFTPKDGADTKLSPLIFLHGLTASKEHWDNIPQIIADHTKRKAYALDARNHGDSQWNDNFGLTLLVEDLLHFMENMSISKAVLFGHSMGGKTTIKAALENPEKFEMVFVEESYVKSISPEKQKGLLSHILAIQEAVENLSPELDETAASHFIRHQLQIKMLDQRKTRGAKYVIPMKRDSEGRLCVKMNQKAVSEALNTPGTMESEPRGLYDGPSFFIYGIKSSYQVPKHEEHIRQFFPNAELVGIEGAGHDVHGEFPEEYTAAVLKIFEQIQKED